MLSRGDGLSSSSSLRSMSSISIDVSDARSEGITYCALVVDVADVMLVAYGACCDCDDSKVVPLTGSG